MIRPNAMRSAFLMLPMLVLPSLGWSQLGPKVRTLTEQEMIDMMVGSSIQASRSADSQPMIKRVKDIFAQGKQCTMVAVDDLPDGWNAVMPTGIGGGGAWEYVRERAQQQKLATVPDAMMKAIDALSKHTGKKFNAVVRSEAAGSTLTAFTIAIALGVAVVDTCPTGRAVPEMQQSTTYINGIPAVPAGLATRWGDILIIDKAVDDYRIEDLARAVAVGSGGSVSMATSLSAAEMKRGTIRGAVSQAILFGRTVREARDQGKDPIAALVKVSGGYQLFHGIVAKSESKGERGFSWSDVELKGINEYQGHVYKVFVKNENIVTWLDGKPDAMSPDLICNLDPKTGDAISGGGGIGGYPMNAEVVMVGIPNSPMWRTPKGIEVFGPRHFGFDFDYVPIEELQKSRRLGTN
jgi:DUF917 family protein